MVCTSVLYQFRLYFVRISKENLSTLLRFAIDNDDKYLMEACKEIIVENFEDVLEAVPRFLACNISSKVSITLTLSLLV